VDSQICAGWTLAGVGSRQPTLLFIADQAP
jgi:hypothetical protein